MTLCKGKCTCFWKILLYPACCSCVDSPKPLGVFFGEACDVGDEVAAVGFLFYAGYGAIPHSETVPLRLPIARNSPSVEKSIEDTSRDEVWKV